jgi:protease IV
VDEIGGLDRAIASAAKLAGIEKYRTTDYPRTAKGLERFLEKLDKTRKDDDAIQSIIVRRELGDMYPIYKSMRDITRTRGIQARLPYEVMIF